ncbi:MAG TPA: hypothetical protein VLN49_16410, partial [Gemmatimonadaceae bacterium]|nr:hypothetical protein [Gemmatimonadaceae bacterium]
MQTDETRDVPEGVAFDSWRLAVLASDEFVTAGGSASPTDAQLRYLASLALLAPSTHNTVPLRMRVDAPAGALDFALDRRAILPQSDAVGRQATVSLGSALANAVLAAEAYGFAATIELRSDAERLLRPAVEGCDPIVPVARLALARATSGSAPRDLGVVDAMLRR